MTKPFWTPERKADYLKLFKDREKRREYHKKYMQKARDEGRVIHWREYRRRKNEGNFYIFWRNRICYCFSNKSPGFLYH